MTDSTIPHRKRLLIEYANYFSPLSLLQNVHQKMSEQHNAKHQFTRSVYSATEPLQVGIYVLGSLFNLTMRKNRFMYA